MTKNLTISYPGFCAIYGNGMPYAAMTATLAANGLTAGFTLAAAPSSVIELGVQSAILISTLSAGVAALGAVFAHDFVNWRLKGENVGSKEGGKRVMRAQGLTWAIGTLAGVAFNYVMAQPETLKSIQDYQNAQQYSHKAKPFSSSLN